MNRFKIINKTIRLIDQVIENHVQASHILLKKHVINDWYNYQTKENLIYIEKQTSCCFKYFQKNNIFDFKDLDILSKISENAFYLLIKDTSKENYEKELEEYLNYQVSFLKLVSSFKSHVIEYKNQHDQLTSIPLRHLMFEHIKKLVSKEKDFYLAFIDIDHFKNINDKMGYDKGDEALIKTSRIINKSLIDGKLYRYGGEEFIVVIPHNNIQQITDVFNELYKNIRDFKISNEKETIDITVTSGIAKYNFNESPIENISNASKLMQKAKNDGRNRYYILK